ncbi:MAG: hypothetical protein QUU85_06910 [Candidatus Eisenbacteria bacterium]|nr:hypothetical protein [Candidatus Eisenbacteria bacterium]
MKNTTIRPILLAVLILLLPMVLLTLRFASRKDVASPAGGAGESAGLAGAPANLATPPAEGLSLIHI